MLSVVQRDGERVVAKTRRSVDQLFSGVGNFVNRIIRGVCMEFNFEHV
jgi:hypothetical protein